MNKLKKCKYCGSKPRLKEYEGGVMIWCPNWDCEPPCTIWEKDKKKAIARWQLIYGDMRNERKSTC